MPKLPAGQQGLSNSPQLNYFPNYPPNYTPNYPPNNPPSNPSSNPSSNPPKEARREEQKTPANEASRRNTPLNNPRLEAKSTGDRDGSKPTEKRRKSDTRPVEDGNMWGSNPTNSLFELTDGSAGGSTLGDKLSGDQLGDAAREAPKAKSLDSHKEERRNDYIG